MRLTEEQIRNMSIDELREELRVAECASHKCEFRSYHIDNYLNMLRDYLTEKLFDQELYAVRFGI